VRTSVFRADVRSAELARIADLVAGGEVRVEIAEVLPLAEVGRAHELSESRHVRGKLILAVASGRT
jgi:NADPH:quinone reductase-like Zn-dependent oxidoreductase